MMCCLFEIEWGGWKGTVQCSAVQCSAVQCIEKRMI